MTLVWERGYSPVNGRIYRRAGIAFGERFAFLVIWRSK